MAHLNLSEIEKLLANFISTEDPIGFFGYFLDPWFAFHFVGGTVDRLEPALAEFISLCLELFLLVLGIDNLGNESLFMGKLKHIHGDEVANLVDIRLNIFIIGCYILMLFEATVLQNNEELMSSLFWTSTAV